MAKNFPPVPPGNRSSKGKPDDKAEPRDDEMPQQPEQNVEQQGQRANIRQNTKNQGFSQTRR
jgi:hypothetical protein